MCDDCGAFANVLAYHVAGLTVATKTLERKTPVQRLAEDLGKPCQHANSRQYLKHRLWGLMWCACPCINGIDCIIGEDWYDTRMSETVRSLRESNPRLADQFYERVVVGHDQRFLARFRESLSRAAD
jgi:hypothetical protein